MLKKKKKKKKKERKKKERKGQAVSVSSLLEEITTSEAPEQHNGEGHT